MRDPNSRRWKRVVWAVTAFAFGIRANGDRIECVRNPVPEDARVVRAGYDDARDEFYCVLEHPSFPTVEPGDIIPLAGDAQYICHKPRSTADTVIDVLGVIFK